MGRPKKVKEISKSDETEIQEKVVTEAPSMPKVNMSGFLKELESKYNIKMASEIKKDEKIRTGLFALDYVLDGGISRSEGGHRIEFYGQESSGKTTTALLVLKRYQELGLKCAFVDVEQSFDKEWAERLGVDTSQLVIAYPEHQEQAGDMLCEMIPNFDLIVIDSVASMIPKAELDGSLDKKHYSSQAQVNSPMTRKLYGAVSGHTCTQIFLNQVREKVGIVYGNPETTPGGKALKHYYNTRIKFKPTEFIEEGTEDKKERIGVVNSIQAVKNKKGKPFRVAAFDFYYNGFIDNRKSLLFSAIKYGIISRGGAWYSYKEDKFQGEDKICAGLDEKVWLEIENEIWKNIK